MKRAARASTIAAIAVSFLLCFNAKADVGGASGDLPGGSAGRGVSFGNMVLYPTLEMMYQFEDNLFKEPANEVDSGAYIVRPKLLLEIPFLANYFQLGYAAEYRTYDDYDMPESWSHFLIANGRLRMANGVELTLRGRHVRSSIYTEEFDPNREVVWGNNPFTRTMGTATLSFQPAQRFGFSLSGEVNSVRFDSLPPTAPPMRRTFFDFDTYEVSGAFVYNLTPLTKLQLEGGHKNSKQDRAYQGLTDDRDASSNSMRVVLSGSLTPTMSGSIFAGYRRTEFDQDIPAVSSGDFKGLVFGINVQNRFTPMTTLEGALFRTENQSSFLGSNYYVSTGGTMTLTYRMSNITFWSVGGSYQKNTYPNANPTPSISTVVREDDISSIKLGVGMYFRERASMRFNYQHEERDSTIPEFAYTNNRYIIELQVGW